MSHLKGGPLIEVYTYSYIYTHITSHTHTHTYTSLVNLTIVYIYIYPQTPVPTGWILHSNPNQVRFQLGALAPQTQTGFQAQQSPHL